VFFGIFALLAALGVPSVKKDPDRPTPNTHVKCPDCAELVRMEAKVCKHCGKRLIPQDKDGNPIIDNTTPEHVLSALQSNHPQTQ
jgi:predicted amidophosphoribosyltransferase